MSENRFACDFSSIDDLLWVANQGTLPNFGALVLADMGRVGPVVELALARGTRPSAYSDVRVAGSRARALTEAIDHRRLSGADANANFGVLPLSSRGGRRPGDDVYEQWVLHFQNVAVHTGFPKPFAQGLAGAIGELVDNVFEHSGQPDTGLVAYCAGGGRVEFVIADTGMGVLASLRGNPDYAELPDAGAALRSIVFDGASRHPKDSGHGEGIRQLFRALAGCDGDLRFRSDDHALDLSGNGGTIDQGRLKLTRKAALPGLAISVLCSLPTRPAGAGP